MQNYRTSPQEMIASLLRNWGLVKASTKREVLGRYRGSSMGLMWSFINPIFMLLVYTFVFSVVFKARWNTGSDSKTEFALILFAGLIFFNIFSECINRAPSLILANVNYVKKVVFPLEILPWVSLFSAFFHFIISLIVWFAAFILLNGWPHITALYLPLILIPFFLFIMGFSWILASLGVYIRDISQFIGLLTTVLMFLSPIFYPASVIPEEYRKLLYLNPLTHVIEEGRAVLYFGNSPDFFMLAIYWVITFFIAWLGFAWFQKTRKGFADVL